MNTSANTSLDRWASSEESLSDHDFFDAAKMDVPSWWTKPQDQIAYYANALFPLFDDSFSRQVLEEIASFCLEFFPFRLTNRSYKRPDMIAQKIQSDLNGEYRIAHWDKDLVHLLRQEKLHYLTDRIFGSNLGRVCVVEASNGSLPALSVFKNGNKPSSWQMTACMKEGSVELNLGPWFVPLPMLCIQKDFVHTKYEWYGEKISKEQALKYTPKQVASWLATINPEYSRYEKIIKKKGIRGLKMTYLRGDEFLKTIGITKREDREVIAIAVTKIFGNAIASKILPQ